MPKSFKQIPDELSNPTPNFYASLKKHTRTSQPTANTQKKLSFFRNLFNYIKKLISSDNTEDENSNFEIKRTEKGINPSTEKNRLRKSFYAIAEVLKHRPTDSNTTQTKIDPFNAKLDEFTITTQQTFMKQIKAFADVIGNTEFLKNLQLKGSIREEIKFLASAVKELKKAADEFDKILNAPGDNPQNTSLHRLRQLESALFSTHFENMTFAAAIIQTWFKNNKDILDKVFGPKSKKDENFRKIFKNSGWTIDGWSAICLMPLQRVQRFEGLLEGCQKEAVKAEFKENNEIIERLLGRVKSYISIVFNELMHKKSFKTVEEFRSCYQKWCEEGSKKGGVNQDLGQLRDINSQCERLKRMSSEGLGAKWDGLMGLVNQHKHVPSMLELGDLAILKGDNKTAGLCFKLAYYYAADEETRNKAKNLLTTPKRRLSFGNRFSAEIKELDSTKLPPLLSQKEKELSQSEMGFAQVVGIRLIELERVKKPETNNEKRPEFEDLCRLLIEKSSDARFTAKCRKIAFELMSVAQNEAEKQLITDNVIFEIKKVNLTSENIENLIKDLEKGEFTKDRKDRIAEAIEQLKEFLYNSGLDTEVKKEFVKNSLTRLENAASGDEDEKNYIKVVKKIQGLDYILMQNNEQMEEMQELKNRKERIASIIGIDSIENQLGLHEILADEASGSRDLLMAYMDVRYNRIIGDFDSYNFTNEQIEVLQALATEGHEISLGGLGKYFAQQRNNPAMACTCFELAYYKARGDKQRDTILTNFKTALKDLGNKKSPQEDEWLSKLEQVRNEAPPFRRSEILLAKLEATTETKGHRYSFFNKEQRVGVREEFKEVYDLLMQAPQVIQANQDSQSEKEKQKQQCLNIVEKLEKISWNALEKQQAQFAKNCISEQKPIPTTEQIIPLSRASAA
ncbi:MAG: hypothetical protein WBE18_03405 [Gammaproteobacteria bacterium]